jgi:uncharacterized repeat protein (TIGR01451 family)
VLLATRSRAAGLISCFVVAGALSAPAATAATPQALLPHAAGSSSAYSALSDGSLVFANAANLPPIDVAKAAVGQSAAGVAVPTGLGTSDQLLQPLLAKSSTGKTAFGHGAGVSVGLLGSQTAPPTIAQTVAEATSPAPSSTSGELLTLPIDPLVNASVLPSTAAANTTANGACVVGKDISNGAAHVAHATVLTPTPGTSVAVLGNTSESVSHTKLVVPTKANGTTVTTGNAGLLAQTTQILAPITLLKGTPGELTIKLLGPLQLSAAAGGVPGTSVVSYAVVGKGPSDPVLTITAGGQTSTLTSQQVFGDGGIVLPLGIADVTIGAPAHSLTGLEGTPVTEAADGTNAAAAVDFVRVSVPGKLPTPANDPVGGPLGSVLNPVLNPVLSGLDPVLSQLQKALADAGLNLADLRVGHLEARSTVPAGGIDCSTDNPLSESRKDVSALHVQPGSTFDYDIRIPNRGASAVTNVKVVDSYSAGLQFMSSVPAPQSHTGHTLTYDLGTLQPDEFRTIVLTFKVPADAVAGTVYHNEAEITGTYLGLPVETTVEVDGPTVGPSPVGACDLSHSTKFASNLKVKTGETFGYFVNVLNSGGEPCLSTTISDTLVDGVTFVSCTGGCTHSGQVVKWDLGTLGAGDSRVVSVLVKVTATSGSLPNTAIVDSPSGTGGKPSTPGPDVTEISVVSPGNPADGANLGLPHTDGGDVNGLPHTGLPAGPAALAVLLMLGAGTVRRHRRRSLGA